MDAQTIQENITTEQVYDLLNHLDAAPRFIEDGVILSRTICHGGDSHKLYYYENSGRFTCYSGGCGYGFSIFDLITMVKDCSFIEALRYIQSFFGLSKGEYAAIPKKERIDTSFFNTFIEKKLDKDKTVVYNKDILDSFYDVYHQSWLDDGISPLAMNKYNIKFSILDQQIIIPHYNLDDELIGVRVRNLDKSIVENGAKYMPLIYNGEMYNHETGKFLYGLNVSKNNINKKKEIILFESEKSCMQLETISTENNTSVALSGSNFSKEQIEEIEKLDVEEIIIAMDKEYIEIGDKREVIYQREIRKKFINKLLPYYKVSIIWDWDNDLDDKDSPSDKGRDVFTKLYNNRLTIES